MYKRRKDLIKVEYANMRKDKAVETALSVGQKEDLFLLCFSCRLLSAFCNRFLLFQSWIELVSDEDDAIVLGALLINPFIRLEVTLNCQKEFPWSVGQKTRCARSCAMPPC